MAGRFDPPGLIDDFQRRGANAQAMADGWDAIVDHWLAHPLGQDDGSEPEFPLFFHPRRHPGGAEQAITWDAFPRVIARWFEDADDPDETRWKAAETLRRRRTNFFAYVDGRVTERVTYLHRQQDEYCEWHVDRDEGGIRRITFTSEGPEYWLYLANGTRFYLEPDHPHYATYDGDLGLVLELYREYVDPAVEESELVWPYDVVARTREGLVLVYPKGSYNPHNEWNTTRGCMHLTHPANTLGAEIALAATATVPYADADDADITDVEDLVCCAAYGDASRSSDPIIGAGVNSFARQGISVSLANPVGLYIADVNRATFRGPDGEEAPTAWKVRRGVDGSRRILRAEFTAPEGATYGVGQMLANGVPISWGGQIADAIQMELTGVGNDLGVGHVERRPCGSKCCTHPEHRGFRLTVGIDESCDTVDWDAAAPLLEPAPEPEAAVAPAEAAPAGSVPLVEADVPAGKLLATRR